MADNKKSFLLYCDLIHTIEKMPKEKAGELFLTILEYVNDKNPEPKDMIVSLVFEPIKQNLKRDLKKYESIVNRNKVNGAKGGRPAKPKKPSGLFGNPKKPKKADIDNDTDTDIVKENKEQLREVKFSKEVENCFLECLCFFEKHLHPADLKAEERWKDTIDKLNRIEKIPFEQIVTIVRRTKADDFWSKQFLTLPKLRKKNGEGLMYILVFNERFKNNGRDEIKQLAKIAVEQYPDI